ncbi:MAG: CpsB/CapC family capsule biosynthesis tyrosine phosphatase [Candidatus Nanopelagicales bacterium]
MIDLHCHVLPGLDDGPSDIRHSVEMVAQADGDGVHTICATPHIRHDHDVRIEELPDRIAALNDAVREAGGRARVLPGGEVAETIVEHLSDPELAAVSLGGGGRWILLEPRPGPLSDSLDHAVVTLRQRGFRSLIAHPERHLVADLFERLARLVGEGALVQATAATMSDPPADRGMRMLAEAGLIHVLASDSHHPRLGREATLSHGFAVLEGVPLLADHLDWIVRAAPTGIIAGDDLTSPF